MATPMVPSYSHMTPTISHAYHSTRKFAKYGQRIAEVERAFFVPVIFSKSRSIGAEAHQLLRWIAAKSSTSLKSPYSESIRRVCSDISLTLAVAASMCIRTNIISVRSQTASRQCMNVMIAS
ncbi:hypothetical protein GJ496_003456 [Pomphorhynchus laevis]|nr:hypothetical protein GJ496_003456 [Pomphorhynchus laevis]